MQQDQNIKGFTILELLVVITIVAIISAVAYPNFSNWRQDRELRAAMEKAATMLSSVNTLSQRGNYPFVQFRVTPNGTTSTKFVSKGMDATSLSIKLNNAQNILPVPINKNPSPSVPEPVNYGSSPYPLPLKPQKNRANDESQYCNFISPAPRNQQLNVPYEGNKYCPTFKPQPYKKDSCYTRSGVS